MIRVVKLTGHDVPVASLSPRQHRLQSVVSHSDALDPFWHRWDSEWSQRQTSSVKKKKKHGEIPSGKLT